MQTRCFSYSLLTVYTINMTFYQDIIPTLGRFYKKNISTLTKSTLVLWYCSEVVHHLKTGPCARKYEIIFVE